jgi:transposase
VWTRPLAKLLLKIKDAIAEVRAGPDTELSDESEQKFLNSYNRLVKRGAKLNPQPDTARRGPPRGRPPSLPTPRTLVHRLQRKRDEVLCFMRDISVPFDNNGSERDLRMVKLQQKISGCFRTPDGARSFCRVRSYLSTARKQGYSLLCALERVLAGSHSPSARGRLKSANHCPSPA